MANDWKKIEVGNTWAYKDLGKDAEFEGLYIGKEENVGENHSTVYSFEVKGDTISVWGSTLLDIRLKNIKQGEEVKIVYLGEEPSEKRKGKTYHNFEVYHREVPFEKVEEEVNLDDIRF